MCLNLVENALVLKIRYLSYSDQYTTAPVVLIPKNSFLGEPKDITTGLSASCPPSHSHPSSLPRFAPIYQNAHHNEPLTEADQSKDLGNYTQPTIWYQIASDHCTQNHKFFVPAPLSYHSDHFQKATSSTYLDLVQCASRTQTPSSWE